MPEGLATVLKQLSCLIQMKDSEGDAVAVAVLAWARNQLIEMNDIETPPE